MHVVDITKASAVDTVNQVEALMVKEPRKAARQLVYEEMDNMRRETLETLVEYLKAIPSLDDHDQYNDMTTGKAIMVLVDVIVDLNQKMELLSTGKA